jgi:hypothetical protein
VSAAVSCGRVTAEGGRVAAVRNATLIGRIAAVAAVALVVIAVVIIVMSGSSGYKVKAVFENASQLVNGDQVQVAAAPWARSPTSRSLPTARRS